MIGFYLSLFFLIIGTISCGGKLSKSVKSFTPYIVGGTVAKPNSWPSQVLIKRTYKVDHMFGTNVTYTNQYESQCGGTLLSKNLILTAAHCITGKITTEEFGTVWTIPVQPNSYYPTYESMFTVYAGAHNISFAFKLLASVPLTVRTSYVSKIETHPNYDNQTSLNDIALLKITPELNETTEIKYARLPAKLSYSIPTNIKKGIVIGWGAKKEGGDRSDLLKQAEVFIYKMTPNCGDYIGNSSLQICAGDLANARDSCQGDSGGGLYVLNEKNKTKEWMLVGIVSNGIGCGRPRTPSLYTRVSAYMDWIINAKKSV